jgi:hypothetical protein
MGGFEPDPGAQAEIAGLAGETRARLLANIATDAKAYAPKRTGALADSIAVDEANGRVTVDSPGVFVEMGHNIVAWGHNEHRQEHPEPFMRPALFQEREL